MYETRRRSGRAERGARVVCAGARADESGDANAILKAMSDYVTSQKSITAAFNTDIEAVTPDLQKIQFASSGAMQLSAPTSFM